MWGHSEEEMNSLTVLQLKQMIAEKMPGNSGDSVEDLRLIFTDKLLDSSCRLSYVRDPGQICHPTGPEASRGPVGSSSLT
ncbi:hypothetical protein SKAU_G00288730 [Synaphobranchus kaupii]|uniref:Ubiquitin-like domain-containing protein n=1 Tax=Synaphobranchus kaupii TaxID=118154 RepID=A0A9Q1IJY6_SYNKA|nr:hypothetical protein SKAU_G00288730 [Synaphobranchus kaupii]